MKAPSPKELLAGKKDEKKGKKKKAHGVHIRGAKGGYIVQHHDASGAPIAGAEHVVPDMDALHQHLDQNLGGGEEGEEAPSPAPPAAQ